jgi:S-methylmethionine-dependent homocysteine/selenocysteine methylase
MSFVSRGLPHHAERLYLTDGGIETSLIFDQGLDLPFFAAFDLLRHEQGRAALARYYEPDLTIAANGGFGFVLESPTWRANSDWADRLGYSIDALRAITIDAIQFMHALRHKYETPDTPMIVSGCVGPRGDGYAAGEAMTPRAADAYHDSQVDAMVSAGCDLVTAITMTNVPEAIGIARAAARHGVPCVISFTVETDGHLPTGAKLEKAIAAVDEGTDRPPAYYMINCAHPTHFVDALTPGRSWTTRLGGVRANASCRSHAELDGAAELDRGNPSQLAAEYHMIAERFPHLRVYGGCCGTDHRHIAAIAAALRAGAMNTV